MAYLSVLAHQRNRQRQGEILRANAHVLNTLSAAPGTPAPPPPPTRAELAALQRANFVETAKDRWNAEVEGAVRWLQTTDWDTIRENAEDGVANLWTRAFGVGDRPAREAVQVTKANVDEARSNLSAAARKAAEETRTRASQVAANVENKSTAAKGVLQRGIEKGKELAGETKTTVELAEKKLASKVESAMAPLSDVEKALQQRYGRGEDIMSKSIHEVLDERYKPIDQRDNTVLRGL